MFLNIFLFIAAFILLCAVPFLSNPTFLLNVGFSFLGAFFSNFLSNISSAVSCCVSSICVYLVSPSAVFLALSILLGFAFVSTRALLASLLA